MAHASSSSGHDFKVNPSAIVDAGLRGRPKDPLIGQVFGSSTIVCFLGCGGMGSVYLADQKSPRRRVAVKVLLITNDTDAEVKERFRWEIEVAALLNHPHVLPIYEAGQIPVDASGIACSYSYYTMMLAKSSLKDCLDRYSANPHAAARLMITVAEAIQYAHEKGVIHRDLKPHNILLTEDNAPYVADFGLAKRGDGEHSLTLSGAAVGTPGYMAPEGNRDTPQADIYSLGATLHAMLTGHPPLPVPIRAPQDEDGHPLADSLDANANVPARLKWICRKCLQVNSDHRFGSAEELAGALRNFLEAEPREHPETKPSPAPKAWLVPLIAGGVGLLTILALCGLIYLLLLRLDAKLGTPAELAMDTDPRRTGAYYDKLIRLVEEAAPGDEILVVANESEAAIDEAQVSDTYGSARQRFYEKLIEKVSSTKDVKYRRIVCFSKGPDVEKLSKDSLRWSFPHCEAMLRLNKDAPDKVCSLSTARSLIDHDILVIGNRAAVITLATRVPIEDRKGEKPRAGKSGVLIFHNPPNAQIIQRLRETFNEIVNNGGIQHVTSLPAPKK